MNEILDQVGEALMSHWVKLVVGFGLMGVGWLTGRWRATKRFESKNHATRWRTLQKMASQLESAPHQYVCVELFV